jgi:hypothetical protein
MHPNVGRDLALLGELNQENGRVAAFLHNRHFNAASSFQIGVVRVPSLEDGRSSKPCPLLTRQLAAISLDLGRA